MKNFEITPSVIRHFLTAIGALLVLVGLSKYLPLIPFLIENVDGLWKAGSTLIGVAVTIYGFFKGRELPTNTETNENN